MTANYIRHYFPGHLLLHDPIGKTTIPVSVWSSQKCSSLELEFRVMLALTLSSILDKFCGNICHDLFFTGSTYQQRKQYMKELYLVFLIAIDEACELPIELVYNCTIKSYIFFI